MVGGSNPLAPTNKNKGLAMSLALFYFLVRRWIRRCPVIFEFFRPEVAQEVCLLACSFLKVSCIDVAPI